MRFPVLFANITVLYFVLTFSGCYRAVKSGDHVLEGVPSDSKSDAPSLKSGDPYKGKSRAEVDQIFKEKFSKPDYQPKVQHTTKETKLRWRFLQGPFKHLARWETGRQFPFRDTKPLCHNDPHDPGGFTCVGVSYTHNKRWYDQVLGYHPPTVKKLNEIFKTKFGQRKISDWYFAHYTGLFYMNCSFKAAFYMGDSAVTSGGVRAIKLLQRSHGLTQDGIFGPRTKKACSEGGFRGKDYIEAEKARYRSLRQFKRYGKGWLRRVDSKENWMINK